MAKKPTVDEKFWRMKEISQLREEYDNFLKDEGKQQSPHTAHVFAMRKTSGSFRYLGLSGREIIMELAGELPGMYE